MNLRDKVIVVTGGATGIGRALCRRFAEEGAKRIVVADLDESGATIVAREVGGVAATLDVADEAQVLRLVEHVTAACGPIDLFCSNAGIMQNGGADAPPNDWQRTWDVNVMAHVHAARALLPGMIARGSGYLLNTASAAGLLTAHNSASYSVSKHAAIAFAEWLSIAHGDQGIRVSVLCPQGVRTDMLLGEENKPHAFLLDGALSPEEVAEATVSGIESEKFLILPHPEVLEYFQRKAGDYDRWIRGMRRLRAETSLD
jgi:NAD(P)-dependent dehydrogenase (short-subunit alcohol dehydrogenase family)